MKRTGLLWIAAAAIVIATAGCSKTANAPASEQTAARAVGTGGAGADVKSDDDFVRDVALKNMAEIELSRMALERAVRPDVKAFARQMIDEHTAAADKLKSLVSGHPITWPAQLDDKHREASHELARKEGDDFDRAYIKALIEGHENLAAKLESRLDVQSVADWKTAAAGRTQSKALPDPKVAMHDVQVRPNKSAHAITMQISEWAAEMYPAAHKHLDTARTLENAMTKRSTD